jgi:type II secretory pathway pseudopilin PulG
MISMAVLSIMAAVTIVSMGGSKTRQEVEGAARQLAAAIRETQNYALTGKNITSTNTNRACRFSVASTVNTASFSIKQANVSGASCGALAVATTYSLQNGVQFSVASREVSFDVPRGEPSDANGEIGGPQVGASPYVDFSFAKNGSTAHVCVYPLGRIEEKPIGGSC